MLQIKIKEGESGYKCFPDLSIMKSFIQLMGAVAFGGKQLQSRTVLR